MTTSISIKILLASDPIELLQKAFDILYIEIIEWNRNSGIRPAILVSSDNKTFNRWNISDRINNGCKTKLHLNRLHKLNPVNQHRQWIFTPKKSILWTYFQSLKPYCITLIYLQSLTMTNVWPRLSPKHFRRV